MRGIVHVRNLLLISPAGDTLRVLDGLGGMLSDVLGETGDGAEGGEAPAAESDGVGPVASSDSRVVESLEYVDLGHRAGVVGEQLGSQEEPHRACSDDGQSQGGDGPEEGEKDEDRSQHGGATRLQEDTTDRGTTNIDYFLLTGYYYGSRCSGS